MSYPNIEKKLLRFGLENNVKFPKDNYRFGKRNQCIPGDNGVGEICDDKDNNDVKPGGDIVEHDTDCYKQIQLKSKKIKQNIDQGVNQCIQNLNDELKCNNDGDYIRCPSSFKDKHNKIKDQCHTEENAMKNIINYCIK